MKWTPYDYAKKTTAECGTDWPITRAAETFDLGNIGSMLVKDASGAYTGLLTDKTLFKAISDGLDLYELTVGELPLEPIVFISKNAGFDEVSMKFRESPSGRIVMRDDNGRIVGVLKKKNIDRFSNIRETLNSILGK